MIEAAQPAHWRELQERAARILRGGRLAGRFGERLAYLGCRAVPGREGDEAIAHGAVSAGTTSTGPRL
jgi:hypothetical protein